MKLHTLDQIDPLILKLGRAVKQDVAAQALLASLSQESVVADKAVPVAAAPSSLKAGDWIEWEGGECPIPSDSRIDYNYLNVDGGRNERAGDLRWDHAGLLGDIHFYRLVKP